MNRSKVSTRVFACLLAFATVIFLAAAGTQARAELKSGAVYVMSNQAANSILVFHRNEVGGLTFQGEFLTGGIGDPVPQGTDPAGNPLASLGALALARDGDFLVAANAGSNDVSVMRVEFDGSLTLVTQLASGGLRPISITASKKTVYVLNEGDIPNITGFTLREDGTFTPIDGSTRQLAGGTTADPARVAFNYDGDILVVTEKATSMINFFTRDDATGLFSAGTSMPSSGLTPTGFAFDRRGHVIVAEAAAAAAGASSLSLYQLVANASATTLSAAVPSAQTGAHAVVIAKNRKNTWVSNTGSGTIASYEIGPGGTLTLLNGTAASTGAGSAPTDMAFGNKSRYLYVLDGALGVIHGYRVEPDKSLTLIADTPGIPLGAQGIAAE